MEQLRGDFLLSLPSGCHHLFGEVISSQCNRLFQLHMASKSLHLVSQSRIGRLNIYTQLPLPLKQCQFCLKAHLLLWEVTQIWTHHPLFCCWWFRVTFLLVNRLHNKILLARKQVTSMRFREIMVYHHLKVLSPQYHCSSCWGDGLCTTTHFPVLD